MKVRSINPSYRLWAVVLLALALRLIGLTERPIWHDEGYSLWFSSRDWAYLWGEVPTFETHPPFYYSLLKMWRGIAGSSEFALRVFSVIASVLVIPLVYASARHAYPGEDGKRLGLLAALLAATWSFQIDYAQEARPYAFISLASAITVCSACWIFAHRERLERPFAALIREDRKAIVAMVGLAMGLALLLWLHNVNALFVAPVGVFLLVWAYSAGNGSGRGFSNLFVNTALTLALGAAFFAPYVPILWAQLTSFGKGFWLSQPNLFGLISRSLEAFGQIRVDTLTPTFTRTVAVVIAGVPAAIGFALGALGLLRLGNAYRNRIVLWFCILAGAGPWLISVAVTYTVQPVFLNRTLIASTIPAILITAAVPWCGPKWMRRPGLVFVLVLAGIGLSGAVSRFTFDAPPSVENRAFLAELKASGLPDAPVLVAPNSAAFPLIYYAERAGLPNPITPLPAPYPVRSERYTYPSGNRGVPEVTKADAERAAAQVADQPTVFVLKRNQPRYDPNRELDTALKAYFACETRLQRVRNYRFIRYDRECGASPAPTATPPR